jgi:hypothetical protein
MATSKRFWWGKTTYVLYSSWVAGLTGFKTTAVRDYKSTTLTILSQIEHTKKRDFFIWRYRNEV